MVLTEAKVARPRETRLRSDEEIGLGFLDHIEFLRAFIGGDTEPCRISKNYISTLHAKENTE